MSIPVFADCTDVNIWPALASAATLLVVARTRTALFTSVNCASINRSTAFAWISKTMGCTGTTPSTGGAVISRPRSATFAWSAS